MPLVNKTFSDIITFSRASSATMFDSSGTLVYAPMNLLTYSEEFDNAAWSKTGLNTTGSPAWVDVEVAPDGNTTADKITEDTSTGTHGCNQNITPVSGTTYSVSVYAKAGERTIVRIATGSSLGTKIAFVDLSSGIITSESGTGTASVTSAGNGWYRIVLVVTATSTTADGLFVRLVSTGTTFSYTGDNTSGLYIWGAQLNIANMQGGVTGDLSTYYPTTTAAYQGPRLDYDPATLAARGLLIEEQRTNLLLQSEDFATSWTTSASPTITTNTTVAPDGTTTADTLASTATGSYVAQIVTFTGDGTKTYSIFIKSGTSSNNRIFLRDTTASESRGQADITWAAGVPSVVITNGSLQSLQSCPNGWYRLAVIVDSVVAANTNQLRIQPDNVSGTGDVIFWGAQIENAAFSTSYIPTTTTSLTRSADVASVNTLSPWFNATEGTLYAEAVGVSNISSATRRFVEIGDGTINNRYVCGYSSTTSTRFLVSSGGLTQADVVALGINAGSLVKLAGAYAVNNFQQASNGILGTADTSGTPPAVTTMHLGSDYIYAANTTLNGHLRRIVYYPRRLSNAELQSITS